MLQFSPSLLQLDRSSYFGEVLVACNHQRSLTMSMLVHLFDNDQGQKSCLLRLVDVTEQIRLNNELRRMHQALRNAYGLLEKQGRELDEARRAASLSIFAAGLSHEMNSPVASSSSNMRSLREFAQDLIKMWPNQSRIPEELEEVKEIAEEVGHDLVRLSNIVRQLSELEALSQPQDFDLLALTRSTLRRFGTVTLNAPDECKVNSDPKAYASVLEKVLNNARQAVGVDASIEVRIEVVDQSIQVTVEDAGPGVPEEIQQRVFDPFFTTRPPGTGLGLGLFLAQRAVSQMGGEISLSGRLGSGTRVVFRFPQAGYKNLAHESYEGFRIG